MSGEALFVDVIRRHVTEIFSTATIVNFFSVFSNEVELVFLIGRLLMLVVVLSTVTFCFWVSKVVVPISLSRRRKSSIFHH